jgi:16S rRNA A1518/A1519 N6-dimethyltransferase RsmA/KsgA/DIM1 with predicted DNA glycosylase/AP lyase activity
MTTLFSARRKMLRRSLSHFIAPKNENTKNQFWKKIQEIGIQEDTRPDAVTVEQMLKVFYCVKEFLL